MNVLPDNILKHMATEDRRQLGKPGRTWDEAETAREDKLEAELQKQVANLLRQRDIWFGRSKMNKRSRYTKGAPDFIFAWRNLPFAFECKVNKREPSTDQIDCHAHMRRNGWMVFVVRSLTQAQELLV